MRQMIIVVAAVLWMWLPLAMAQEPGPVPGLLDQAQDMDVGSLVLFALLAISEGLALVPSLASNGILHAIILGLRRATGRGPMI